MKTPITLEDPRLTAYALGDLSNPDDVATIEAALKESPELRAYVSDILDLGETLTLEFAKETLPVEEPTVVTPKRSVWRYVAPLGVAAAIALAAVQLVDTSDRVGASPERALVSEPDVEEVEPKPAEFVTNVLPSGGVEDYIEAEAKLVSLGEQFGLNESMFENRGSLTGDPVTGVDSVTMQPMSEGQAQSTLEERRQVAQYAEALKEVEFQRAHLANADGLDQTLRGVEWASVDESLSADAKVGFGNGMNDGSDARLAFVDMNSRSRRPPSTKRGVEASPSKKKRRVIPAPAQPTFAEVKEADRHWRGRATQLSTVVESVTRESYAPTSDNAFKEIVNPGDERATFSTDVDTASYSNVRRFLNNGQLPPKDAVRVEEMINYFHYDYPQPEGEHPFSVNLEVNEAPWKSGHRLLRIGLKAKDVMVDKRPDSNLVFLVDVSGSMNSYDKLPLLKKSLKAMVGGLTERDLISIVTYAGQSKVHLPPTPGQEKGQLIAAIDQLQSGGSTNGASGIQMAYEQASKHRMANGVNRVLLATDGDFNVGVTSTDELVSMAKKRAKEDQVFLTVLGFGQGNVQDDRMEQLANKVDGSYHYIDTEREGRKVLVDEMSATLVPIAKDVKIQVEFNPAKVKSYRLIGYANRLLANRDFTDDKKDAGDMGAGHTVTAFYEIVPNGGLSLGPNAAPLKYRSAKAVEPEPVGVSEDLVTVRLRYKQPKEETSQEFETSLEDAGQVWNQASEDFRFATSVAAFGMVLRSSPYCQVSLATIRDWAKEAKSGDEYGWRAECVQLIEKAMQL